MIILVKVPLPNSMNRVISFRCYSEEADSISLYISSRFAFHSNKWEEYGWKILKIQSGILTKVSRQFGFHWWDIKGAKSTKEQKQCETPEKK